MIIMIGGASMENYIDKIYKLMYSPIVTPYNLLENAKLDNYSYVNYYKGEYGITAEMKCITDDEVETVFYYNFDHEDKLFDIHMEVDSVKTLVFDRKEELMDLKSKFRKEYEESIESAV